MTTLKRFVYDSWDGGEFGTLGEVNAPKNSFHGTNVIPYASGHIGPRPGLRNITPQSQPNGTLLGFASTPTPGRDGIFIIGTTAYRFNLFDPTGDTPVSLGSVPNGTGEIVFPKLSTTTNIATTVPEGAVEIDQINGVVTDLTSPGGHTHEIFGDQLVLAENTSSNQIFASAIGDYSDWSGSYTFQVGDKWQVTALEAQHNYLTIVKRTGIYVLSGPPTNENTSLTIRRVLGVDGVLHPWQVAMDSHDNMWIFRLFRSSPAVFSGASLQVFGHLEFNHKEEDGTAALPPVKRSVVVLHGQLTPDTIAFIQGGSSQEMFLYANNTWSHHVFGTTISAMARGVENNLVITDGGGSGTPAQFYATRFDIDRPGFISDGLYGPGDNSNTPVSASFQLPAFLNQDGRNVRIRSVTLEVKKWNWGGTNNTVTVDVDTLSRPNSAGDVSNDTSSWSQAATESSTTGTYDRLVFGKYTKWGQGWRIRVSNLTGMAIRSIHVEYEEDPAQPRTNNG